MRFPSIAKICEPIFSHLTGLFSVVKQLANEKSEAHPERNGFFFDFEDLHPRIMIPLFWGPG